MCCGAEYEGMHVICPLLTLNILPEMNIGSASFQGGLGWSFCGRWLVVWSRGAGC